MKGHSASLEMFENCVLANAGRAGDHNQERIMGHGG
jgi:hypothetical protein